MAPTSIVGHATVVASLEAAVRQAGLAHASLLTGPEGVGKTTVAEHVAAVALGADAWPGGLLAHPDHWLEDAPGERIGIDRVRAGGGSAEGGPSLQDFMALRAYAGGARVAVIGRADRLTEQAANSLLKTLEEPPPGAHLLLCSANPERMPATILSRCQAWALAAVPADRIAAWLAEARGVDRQLALTAAALSSGRPGRALQLATQPGRLAQEAQAIDALLRAAGGGRAGALAAAEALAPPASAEGRERALTQVSAWTSFVRDVALLASGAPELCVWTGYRRAAEHWAEALPAARVTELLGRLVDTLDRLAAYAVPRLVFEVLFLDMFTVAPAPPHVTPPRSGLETAGPPAVATDRPRPRQRGTRRRG